MTDLDELAVQVEREEIVTTQPRYSCCPICHELTRELDGFCAVHSAPEKLQKGPGHD